MIKKSKSKRSKKNKYYPRSKVETIITPLTKTESSTKILPKELKTITNNDSPSNKRIKRPENESTNVTLVQRIGNQIKNHPLIAIIIFVIAIISFLMTTYQIYMYHYDKSRELSTGTISGQIINEKQPLVIKFAGTTMTIPFDTLRRGINLNKFLTIDGLSIPIKVYSENNRLLFDIDIYDNKGRNICSVVRNEWKVYPNGVYDKNSNSNAFEIVDAEQFPIFQIQFKEDNKVEIGGYTISPNGYYNIYNSDRVEGGIDKAKAKTVIERLFKYPSSTNQGVREKNPSDK